MTTIAVRDGIMAGDSLGTVSGWKQPGRERKLFRLDNGCIAGLSGDVAQGHVLLAWVKSDRSEEQPKGDARISLLHPNKRIEVFEDGGSYFENAPFMAWGSGMPAALGALHAGASAKEAVRIASLVDTLTGGKIITMALKS